MVSLLQGFGDFAGGLAPGVASLAGNQSQGDIGNAIAQIYGGQPQQQSSPLGSLMSMLQGQSATPNAQAPQQSSPAAMPSGGAQPAVAQAGGLLGQGGQAQSPMQAPQQAPQQPPQQQPQPAPQGQPQQRPQAQQQQAPQGQLDLPTLAQHLVKNGLTGRRLADAMTNPRVISLLNAQGLQQYRDVGMQLRAQNQDNQEKQREFNRDPSAQGSTAQNRVANQGIAAQRMEGVQQRFQARMEAATDKLKNAKTDKEALQAKTDLDKVASDLQNELKSELSIAMAPGTSPDEQKAAMQKAAEIRQQMQDATDAAIKARRSGGANGDQVGGVKGTPTSDKGDGKPNATAGGGDTAYNADGKPMKYKGTGDRKDPANWEEVSGQ